MSLCPPRLVVPTRLLPLCATEPHKRLPHILNKQYHLHHPTAVATSHDESASCGAHPHYNCSSHPTVMTKFSKNIQ